MIDMTTGNKDNESLMSLINEREELLKRIRELDNNNELLKLHNETLTTRCTQLERELSVTRACVREMSLQVLENSRLKKFETLGDVKKNFVQAQLKDMLVAIDNSIAAVVGVMNDKNDDLIAVSIRYITGELITVNVKWDSLSAIVRDVMRHI